MPLDVLLIDDERNIRTTVAACIEGFGHRCTAVASAADALAAVEAAPYDLALLDLKLGTASGLDLLPELLARAPGLAVVLVTAFATLPTAVEAIRRGARDYLAKPFTPAQVRLLLDEIEGERRLRHRVGELEQRLREIAPEADLESQAPAMRAVLDTARRAAATDVPVLLRGESGTGKGVLAQFLHVHSARRDGPFAVVNCPTLSEELLASELFGHVRGAFTGAVRDQPGRVELARGGTLFLDEIGDLAPAVQAKLLRFLQDQSYERVGDGRTRTADVRIVAATNQDLARAVREGRFREDLLFRLDVLEIVVPPLRARVEDIAQMAERFLAAFAAAQRRPGMAFAPGVLERLRAYPWPGNVRELRNAIERAVILSPGARIDAGSLPSRLLGETRPEIAVGADVSVETLEREHIVRVLARHATQDEAARVLGLDPATLWRKRKRWEGG
jgi:NtrC-family two-component system response regulator AlgB